MSILSLKFFALVIVLLFLYYIFPKNIRWIILLLGSLIFYYLSSHKLIIFVLISSLLIYLFGLFIDKLNIKIKNEEDKEKKNKIKSLRKTLLILCILLNIGLLVGTKYSKFTLENINNLLKLLNINYTFNIGKILMPLGISYYTLEAISYITDISRGKINAEKNPLKVLLYLTYFPNITEGPISRFNELSVQFFSEKKIDFNKILIGIDLLILGLFKKMVIADRAGIYVNNVFEEGLGGITVLVAIILYTVQIYAEFGGCIDIVRGISYMFNIELPSNFKRPFFSKDVNEFWRRWHISLGAWIKEYVFYPISLSKMNMSVTKFFKKHTNNFMYKFICSAFPLLFVWLVNGLWHGASYKYILYGMYYYVVMMIGLLIKPLKDKILEKLKIKQNNKVLNIYKMLRTTLLVIIGMTLFRSSSFSEFIVTLKSVFLPGSDIYSFGLCSRDFIVLIVTNLFILLIGILEEKNIINMDKGFTNNVIARSVIYTLVIVSIVIFGMYGPGYDAGDFIYGAF